MNCCGLFVYQRKSNNKVGSWANKCGFQLVDPCHSNLPNSFIVFKISFSIKVDCQNGSQFDEFQQRWFQLDINARIFNVSLSTWFVDFYCPMICPIRVVCHLAEFTTQNCVKRKKCVFESRTRHLLCVGVVCLFEDGPEG